jgi:hypothetical protein
MQIFMVVAVVLAATGLVVVVDAQKAQRFFCDGSFFCPFGVWMWFASTLLPWWW